MKQLRIAEERACAGRETENMSGAGQTETRNHNRFLGSKFLWGFFNIAWLTALLLGKCFFIKMFTSCSSSKIYCRKVILPAKCYFSTGTQCKSSLTLLLLVYLEPHSVQEPNAPPLWPSTSNKSLALHDVAKGFGFRGNQTMMRQFHLMLSHFSPKKKQKTGKCDIFSETVSS